jgi:uncharacterized protein YmfQ (DUF2313 family)
VAIDEFRPFRVGSSGAGDALTNGLWAFAWYIQAPEVSPVDFCVGQSAVGEPLRAWGNDTLECKITQLKPAHTIPIFAYGFYDPLLDGELIGVLGHWHTESWTEAG